MSHWKWFLFCVIFAFMAMPLSHLRASDDFVVPRPASVDFPILLETYEAYEKQLSKELGRPLTIAEILRSRIAIAPMNLVVTLLFVCAIIHTFLAPRFYRFSQYLCNKYACKLALQSSLPADEDATVPVSFWATVFRFLGEIEAIFGIWLIPVAIIMTLRYGWDDFSFYVSNRVSYAEAMFVVVIMTMSASKPILSLAEWILGFIAKIGRDSASAWWIGILIFAPLLGSFITEPAAITIAAILLARKFYSLTPSPEFSYATIGLLFANISVGGTLTHFAAPPVLIVANKWHWDLIFMFTHFGWRAIIGIVAGTFTYAYFFRKELRRLNAANRERNREEKKNAAAACTGFHMPIWIIATHILFIAWTVFNLHSPQIFWFTFLIFLAFIQATAQYQNIVSLREPILVGFFLAGLVTHGGLQEWWIAPIIRGLSDFALFGGALVLSTFNDNAAITYLTSLVPEFANNRSLQYAVAVGALSGGGLTVIANAPNPAGQSILKEFFPNGVSPLFLFLAAALPTTILALCFLLL
ncbi:MAG: putative Na+/H+ antiporter [Puniceicoccales bacterium]|nr:putative Na+/H+ antiporter [Puniceicoccales bacterium]